MSRRNAQRRFMERKIGWVAILGSRFRTYADIYRGFP